MVNQKQVTPLYQAFTRQILILGGERENVIILGAVALGLWTVGRDVVSAILALVLWFIGITFSKLIAKVDPWATKVFIKSLQYQDFYPAREKMNTPKNIIKSSRKI